MPGIFRNADQLRYVGSNRSAPHQKYIGGYYSNAEVKINYKG